MTIVESTWATLRDSLLEATDETCGWTKGPARHSQTWWWNDEIDQCIKEKRRLWKELKSGGSKNLYLEAKCRARTAMYAEKQKQKENRFADVLRREDQRNEVFKIAKQMKKTNQDVIGEKCIHNDEGNLASTEEEKKLAWKSHYEKLLNTELDWDRETEPKYSPLPSFQPQIPRKVNQVPLIHNQQNLSTTTIPIRNTNDVNNKPILNYFSYFNTQGLYPKTKDSKVPFIKDRMYPGRYRSTLHRPY